MEHVTNMKVSSQPDIKFNKFKYSRKAIFETIKGFKIFEGVMIQVDPFEPSGVFLIF